MAAPSSQHSSRPGSSAGAAKSPVPQGASPVHPNQSLSSSVSSLAPSQHTPSKPRSSQTSPSVSHRASFAENLRNYPPSPRAQRTPSFSGQALQDLLMHPNMKNNGEETKFKGRDWKSIHVNEITDPVEVRFVELDTNIEDTTKLLIRSGAPNVVLVRESRKTKTAIGTFGYDDLNAYLLLVLGLSKPDEAAVSLAERARSGEKLPLSAVIDHIGSKELPAFLPHTADLTRAMEVLGGGAHRLIITKEGTSEVVGILTQLRLVRFFWENHQSFASTENLYSLHLKELALGQQQVTFINGDKPLSEALLLMLTEGISSLPVLDSQKNVVGNISHVDVRLLTDTSAIPLLSQSCIHFIGVILSERGMEDGKDSYPVFHVTPFSSLAHTVAKLVATRSHRMWIVDAPSPASSVPPSPGVHTVVPPFSLQNSGAGASGRAGSNAGDPHSSSHHQTQPTTAGAPSAGQLPGAGMSGRLNGVVSLTDVLNLFARASGLAPEDPAEARRRRRRSSSSSLRPSMEGVRPSAEMMRGSGELSRSGSLARERGR